MQPDHTQKIWRLPNNEGLIAMTGASYRGMKIVHQLLRGEKPDADLKDEARVIVIRGGGALTIYEGDYYYDNSRIIDFMAWGSGSPVAWGALAAGASAVEAIKIASRFDGNTGGVVHCEKVPGWVL